MRIAIASGKGGTGKTTVAVGLAQAWRDRSRAVHLVDCDVEEPNCHLLLTPQITGSIPVTVPIPTILPEECDRCGSCVRLCAFGAITLSKDGVTVFPELCHACGGCAVVCPRDAIVEKPREIGHIEVGHADGIQFTGGWLRVGEPQAVPVIEAVRAHATSADTTPDSITLLDIPPGTSCPVIASVRDTDFVVLVAEPTPFGLHDLTLITTAMRDLDRPIGIVISRVGIGDDRVRDFAQQRGIPVLAEIPNSRTLAPAQARGQPIGEAAPEVATAIEELTRTLEQQVSACAS
jgi:MinD superfamily P-loop ATPase